MSPDVGPEQLAETWRSEADTLRRRGCDSQARLLESLAGDLEAALAAGDAEPVTLAEASRLSGYSQAQLRRLIGEEKLHNVGQGRRVAIARGELPRKPGHKPVTLEDAAGAVIRLRQVS